MPDIAMCQGTNCPLRSKCHRFTAVPFPRGQSWLMEVPYKDGKCEFFWDNANRRKKLNQEDVASNS